MTEEVQKWIEKVNVAIHFDDQYYLRETAANLEVLQEGIAALELALIDANEADRYFLSGILGNWYRIYSHEDRTQFGKAKEHFDYCLSYAIARKDGLKQMVTMIRMGEMLKYDGQHERALEWFETARELCEKENLNGYADFVLQHMGKCHLEMHQFQKAEMHLQEAMKLRQQKGDEALITSTKEALELVSFLRDN